MMKGFDKVNGEKTISFAWGAHNKRSSIQTRHQENDEGHFFLRCIVKAWNTLQLGIVVVETISPSKRKFKIVMDYRYYFALGSTFIS